MMESCFQIPGATSPQTWLVIWRGASEAVDLAQPPLALGEALHVKLGCLS